MSDFESFPPGFGSTPWDHPPQGLSAGWERMPEAQEMMRYLNLDITEAELLKEIAADLKDTNSVRFAIKTALDAEFRYIEQVRSRNAALADRILMNRRTVLGYKHDGTGPNV